MPSRRYFANNAPQLTLNGSITSAATSLTISGTFSGWPTQFPYFAALDYGTASAEIVSVTAVAGTTATIVRAQGGTAAISHAAGATLDHVVVALDLDEANAHTTASAGVHGVSGSVVGTSDSQTLSNKTLSAPIVTGGLTANSANISGSVTTGALSAASVAATGASSAASYTATGDGAVNGVLVPKTYTNEAAATSAIGTPVAGTVAWLSTPTTPGTAAGLFVYNGGSWIPDKRPRIGARATTNATQALSAGVAANMNNGGTAAWTALEDSGGFVSAVGGTTTPIIIPTGLAGLYSIGVKYTQSVSSTARLLVIILVNATEIGRLSNYNDSFVGGAVTAALNAGDTLGFQAFSATAASVNTGAQVYAYRISD